MNRHDREVLAQGETTTDRGGRPPKYTPQQRAEALDAAREHGATEAARRTGIPARSIQRWATDAGVDLASTTAAATVKARAVAANVRDKGRAERMTALVTALDDVIGTTAAAVATRRRLVDQLASECETPVELASCLTAAGIDPGDEAATLARLLRAVHDVQDRDETSRDGAEVHFVVHRIPRPPRPEGTVETRTGPWVPIGPGERLVGDNGLTVDWAPDGVVVVEGEL